MPSADGQIGQQPSFAVELEDMSFAFALVAFRSRYISTGIVRPTDDLYSRQVLAISDLDESLGMVCIEP